MAATTTTTIGRSYQYKELCGPEQLSVLEADSSDSCSSSSASSMSCWAVIKEEEQCDQCCSNVQMPKIRLQPIALLGARICAIIADQESPGCCALLLAMVSLLLVVATLPFSLCLCVKALMMASDVLATRNYGD